MLGSVIMVISHNYFNSMIGYQLIDVKYLQVFDGIWW